MPETKAAWSSLWSLLCPGGQWSPTAPPAWVGRVQEGCSEVSLMLNLLTRKTRPRAPEEELRHTPTDRHAEMPGTSGHPKGEDQAARQWASSLPHSDISPSTVLSRGHMASPLSCVLFPHPVPLGPQA